MRQNINFEAYHIGAENVRSGHPLVIGHAGHWTGGGGGGVQQNYKVPGL